MCAKSFLWVSLETLLFFFFSILNVFSVLFLLLFLCLLDKFRAFGFLPAALQLLEISSGIFSWKLGGVWSYLYTPGWEREPNDPFSL